MDEAMRQKVLALAQEHFRAPELDFQSQLQEGPGYDSMSHVEFLLELEEHYGAEIKDEEVRRDDTVQRVLELVEARRKS